MFRCGGPSGLMPKLGDDQKPGAVQFHPFYGCLDSQYQSMKSELEENEKESASFGGELVPLFYNLISTDSAQGLVSAQSGITGVDLSVNQ